LAAKPFWLSCYFALAGGLLVGDEMGEVLPGGCRQEKGSMFSGCRGDVPGEIPAPTLSVPAAVAHSITFLLGDACRGASSTPPMASALQEKSQASGSWAGDGGVYVTSFLEASSWRARIQQRACVSYFVDMMVDVGAAAPSGGLASRGGGFGDHVEQLFHGAEKLFAWIWWQSCVACAARLSARSKRLREAV
jgi:hypothetical protein